MRLRSIASAAPPSAFTQRDCWEIFARSEVRSRLSDRAGTLMEKVLLGDSGIGKRHFALDEVERLFDMDAESLNAAFEAQAPALAAAALERALDRAALAPEALDALFVCTCTGYLCPGLSSHLGQRLGLGESAFLQDIVGLGCGAAIPMLRGAHGFLAANPDATVACVAVEICSAAFYLDNDPGVLISACLFGDGAAATIWDGSPDGGRPRLHRFDTLHRPRDRELLRFVNAGGKLRNKLHRSVPAKAAEAVDTLRRRSGFAQAPVAAHTGGRDVLEALENRLACGPLAASRETLRRYGNTSSSAVLFVLEDMLAAPDPPETIWLTAFGAGFAAHSCALSR